MRDIDEFLEAVSHEILASVAETSACKMGFDVRLLSGKRLRSRMAFHVGLNIPRPECVAAAAAVELFHTASLLHDDVIDGSQLRRGVPADCIQRGATASILLGDRFVAQSMLILVRTAPGTVERFLHAIGELCEAEMEHESLIGRGASSLERLLGIARRKTGSLFAFIGHVCGGNDASLAAALECCGYALGAAYQFLDDGWDSGGPSGLAASKTLGSDERRGKPTLANSGFALAQRQVSLDLAAATRRLSAWPAVEDGWSRYLAEMRSLAAPVRAFG